MKIVIENVSLFDLDRISALMYAFGFNEREIRSGCTQLLASGVYSFSFDGITVNCRCSK